MNLKLTAINPIEDDAIRSSEFTPCWPAIKSFISQRANLDAAPWSVPCKG
jgi:hypothetical protein